MMSTLEFAKLHDAGLSAGLPVGSLVGSRRWPSQSAHPACWLPPHRGVILAQNDVRAWVGSIAFGATPPTQLQVNRHVDQIRCRGLLVSDVPVLWSFFGVPKVYWSDLKHLRPADDDYREWLRERSLAFARAQSPRLAAA